MVIQDCAPLANYLDDLINLLADHSFLVNSSGDLKPMTSENTASATMSPKKFKDSLAHQIRYFRFTHRTKILINSETETESDVSQEAEKFFSKQTNNEKVPELEDPSDIEHHML